MNKNNLKKTRTIELTYFPAMTALLTDIDRTLKDLINPLNKAKERQDKLVKHLYALLTDWYSVTKQCLKVGDIQADPSGILSNTTLYSTEKALNSNPFTKLIPAYIQKLIDNDKDTPMSTTKSNVVPMPVKAVEDTKAADAEWNKPYINAIEEVLSKINDADIKDTSSLKTLNSQLKSAVRKWVDATYKSIHDLENDNRLKSDIAGVIEGKTIFSSPEYVSLYDSASEVDKLIEVLSKKHKEKLAGNEISTHTMADALAKAQDENTKTFEVETGNGESVAVNKETGDVTIKKDGFVVRTAKAAYQGVKKFFEAILAQLKRFGAWVKSWFVSEEKPDVMSKEDADAYDAAVLARQEALAS